MQFSLCRPYFSDPGNFSASEVSTAPQPSRIRFSFTQYDAAAVASTTDSDGRGCAVHMVSTPDAVITPYMARVLRVVILGPLRM